MGTRNKKAIERIEEQIRSLRREVQQLNERIEHHFALVELY